MPCVIWIARCTRSLVDIACIGMAWEANVESVWCEKTTTVNAVTV